MFIKRNFITNVYDNALLMTLQQQKNIQSTFNSMFGGRLETKHIHPLREQNCLLAVFSNQLYVFDLLQTQIVKKLQLSENLIITWTFLQSTFKLIALDQSGSLIEVNFTKSNKNHELWYQNFKISSKKVTKGKISDAKIVIQSQFSSDFCVYFIEENNLYEYRSGTKNITAKQTSRILFASDKHVILSNANKQSAIKIITLNGTKSNQELLFEHSTPITACTVQEQNLIVGDVKGKIYQLRNYFQTSKVNQQITTKYEWHVHQINALHLDQEYLYSCGQEGTVVMWHLRQNKKDFLPRIGTEIDNVFTSEGVVYCLLKDNSIVSVDLNNDKALKYYKTVVNPFGFMTKSIKENSFKGNNFSLLSSSETNRRNLLVAPGLPGSLQLINLNDGSNQQINVLPRNMISRIDDHYPEPHEIHDVNFNKEWTLMCCSTKGVNHNYLHFYKNEGYNLEYTLISRIQNPHEGSIKVLSYNNNFITYSQNENTVRFWSRVRRAKKSIIEKEEEYFVCSGEITYRQKPIKNCNVLADENLLLVNFEDEIIFVDLKKRAIEIAFRIKNPIQQAVLVKKSKNLFGLILICQHKIQAYELNRTSKTITNPKTIFTFGKSKSSRTTKVSHFGSKTSFLINYESSEIIVEFDLTKNTVVNSFEIENVNEASILSLCYQNGKLLGFGSDSCLINLTDNEEIVKVSAKEAVTVSAMETEQESRQDFEHEDFESLHKNFVERQNVRRKGQITECLQKIELQMYPSLGFSFSALCEKMFL